MRSRALLGLLVLSLLAGSTGVVIAAGGSGTSNGNATVSQYNTPAAPTEQGQRNKGGKNRQGSKNGGDELPGGENNGGDELPGGENNGAVPGGTTPVSTTAGGSASLPFTGYLVIPVLLLGAIMLGIGVAVRRRSTADRPRL